VLWKSQKLTPFTEHEMRGSYRSIGVGKLMDYNPAVNLTRES
jgi:hypothetical protein